MIRGQRVKVGAPQDASWFAASEKERGETSVHMEHIFWAGTPSVRGHIFMNGQAVHVRHLTVFSGHLTHGQAIRWGLFGILRLGVMRRQFLRRLFRLKQVGLVTK